MLAGRYELNADTLVIVDKSGPYACPAAPGRYLWQRSEAGLTFQLVSDACQGRSGPLTSGVWAGPRPPTVVFRGATLIDGTGAPVRENVDVVVGEGRILSVEPAGSAAVPAGAEVHDITGKWLVPGLIDGHVHLLTDPSGEDAAASVESRLRNALLGGINTVRIGIWRRTRLHDAARAQVSLTSALQRLLRRRHFLLVARFRVVVVLLRLVALGRFA